MENKSTLNKKLSNFTKRYYQRSILQGIIVLLSGAIGLLVLFAVAEYFIRFSSPTRLFLLVSFVAIFTVATIKYLLIPLLKYYGIIAGLQTTEAAKLIGDYYPEINDKLLNLIQLQDQNSETSLVQASIEQKTTLLLPFEFNQAISFKQLTKVVKWAVIPLVFAIIIAAFNNQILTQGTKRIVQYNQTFTTPNPYEFELLNTNNNVVRNSNYKVQIQFKGDEIPKDVFIGVNDNKYRLSKGIDGTFSYEFRNVQEDINFNVQAEIFTSKTYKINLLEKPTINNLKAFVTYPKYINKPAETFNNNGDLIVPGGSTISWTFSTKNTSNIAFTINDSITKLSPNNEGDANFKTQAFKSFAYKIQAENKVANIDEVLAFNVNVIADEYPQIKVTNFVDSINPFMLYHSGIIADDYGFKKLNFYFFNEDTSGVINIPIPKNLYKHKFNHSLNAKDLNLSKSDAFEYYFEVFDNDGIQGSKSTKSSTRSFSLPSKNNVEKLIADNNKDIKKRLDDNLAEAEKLQQEFDEIRKMMLEKKRMDWQDKARINDFLQNQKSFEQEIEQLQFEQQKNTFQKEQLTEQEQSILQKQQQINELFEQLMDEETKKLYEELEKLLEDMNPEKVKETLEEINLNNEELEKELDRTLELFKQMEFDEELQKTIDKLDELSEKQQELSNETESNKKQSQEELSQKQEALNKEFEKVQEQFEDLREKNEALENPNNLESTEEAQEEIKQEQQKASDELGKNNRKKSSKSQQNAADKMQALSNKMQQMQSEMQSEQQMEDINALRQILENLITFSVEQEDLMENIKKTNRYDPIFPELATKQGDLKESAKIIEDSLLALSKRQISLQAIVNKEILDIQYNIDKSIDLLRERDNYAAAVKQQYVMTSANNLALLLDESLQQMQQQMQQSQKPGSGSCSKPGGSKPKPGGMPNIKSLQKSLSKKIEEMKKQMEEGNKKGKSGKQGKSGMAKSLAEMSAQQQAIKQQLEQLNNQQKKQGKGGLGELEDLQKQMEQNERDILNKNITRETIIRQEQIMGNLLKAEKALRERELDDKREAQQTNKQFNRNPKDFTPYKSFELKEEESLKTIPSSFNLFYKRRISDYFNIFEE